MSIFCAIHKFHSENKEFYEKNTLFLSHFINLLNPSRKCSKVLGEGKYCLAYFEITKGFYHRSSPPTFNRTLLFTQLTNS